MKQMVATEQIENIRNDKELIDVVNSAIDSGKIVIPSQGGGHAYAISFGKDGYYKMQILYLTDADFPNEVTGNYISNDLIRRGFKSYDTMYPTSYVYDVSNNTIQQVIGMFGINSNPPTIVTKKINVSLTDGNIILSTNIGHIEAPAIGITYRKIF